MPRYPRAGDRVGRYEIRSELGRGAMGAVYLARDPKVGREVAVKILLPQYAEDEHFLARFEREAAALAGIRSRHIVPIYDVDTDERYSYLVTEYFSDGDLRARLKARGPLATPEAIALMRQVCEAVADAHAAGIVHRDIKASNVLLWDREDGLHAYLSDFGIAGQADSELTLTGHGIGTLATMAPERHLGARGDERGDIYSLGCLLYTTLVGRPPFGGGDYQIVHAHLNDPIPAVPDVVAGADGLNSLLIATMAKDPADRPASVREVRSRLTGIELGTVTEISPIREQPTDAYAGLAQTDNTDDSSDDTTDDATVDPPPVGARSVERAEARSSPPTAAEPSVLPTIYIPTTPASSPTHAYASPTQSVGQGGPTEHASRTVRALGPLHEPLVADASDVAPPWRGPTVADAKARLSRLGRSGIVGLVAAVALLAVGCAMLIVDDARTDTPASSSTSNPASGNGAPIDFDPEGTARCWNGERAESAQSCPDPVGPLAFDNAFPAFADLSHDDQGPDLIECIVDCGDQWNFANEENCSFQSFPDSWQSGDHEGWLVADCGAVRVPGLGSVSNATFTVGDGGQGQNAWVFAPLLKSYLDSTDSDYTYNQPLFRSSNKVKYWAYEHGEYCNLVVRYRYHGRAFATLALTIAGDLASCRGAAVDLVVTPPSKLRQWNR